MRTVRAFRPWSLEALVKREQTFDGLISKAVRMSLRPMAMNVNGLLTAAVEAELSLPGLSDLASSMLGPTVSMDSAGALSVTWDRFVDNELLPFLTDTFMDGAKRTHAILPADVPIVADFVAQDYLETAANNLRNLGDLVWMNVRAELQEGVETGEDMTQLAGRVRAASQVSAARAMTIARTEVHRAAETGSLAQMTLSGFTSIECSKRWLATEDERTRLWHIQADGQTVGLHESFDVGEEWLQYPGDPNGRADNTINCRCTMEYLFEDEVEGELTASGVPSQITYALWTVEDEKAHPRDNVGRFRKKNEVSSSDSDIGRKIKDALISGVNAKRGEKTPIPPDIADTLANLYSGTFANLNIDDVKVTRPILHQKWINVGGDISSNKNNVGMFSRKFYLDHNGDLAVEHVALSLNRNQQGQGFSQAFNEENAFPAYRKFGVKTVSVLANGDVGGYTWARAGYDWKPDDIDAFLEIQKRINAAAQGAKAMPNKKPSRIDQIPAERREEQIALAQKLFADVGNTVSDSTNPDTELPDIIEIWPTPFELSQLGRWPGAGKDDWWIGKVIMMGSSWWGVRYVDDLASA